MTCELNTSIRDMNLWFGLKKKRFEKFKKRFGSLKVKDMASPFDDDESPIIS